MYDLTLFIELCSKVLEGIGILIIVCGTLFFLIKFGVHSLQKGMGQILYTQLKHGLGKTILLGLEVLVAADIIATVITTPTLEQVSSLAIIILIRTLLSFSLQVEIDGKLPWNKK